MLNDFLFDSAGIGAFGEASNVSLFLPGLPSLVQHHTYLDNVMITGMKVDDLIRQHTSVLAGSTSAYHSVQLIAKNRIERGQELFLFPQAGRHLESTQPKKEIYQMAEQFITKLGEYASSDQALSITTAQWADLLYRIRMDVMEDSPAAKLLPRSYHELKNAVDKGLAISRLHDRSLNWILKHGTCLDSIRQGDIISLWTNTTHAEKQRQQRGAVATRFLQEGTIVTETPMIPVEQDLLLMRANEKNSSRQLLWNYCLGHRQASILFCPTTAAAMMKQDAKTPNVGLRWKEPSTMLQASLDDFWSQSISERNNLLVLEYVALRDIGEDEELLLDYGAEWEQAYRYHLTSWISDTAESQIPNETSSLRVNGAEHVKTEPYMVLSENIPTQFAAECRVYPQLQLNAEFHQWQNFVDSNQMLHRKNWSTEQLKLYREDDRFAAWYPCEVVVVGVSSSSDVLVFPQHIHDKTVVLRFRGFPQERIRLVDAPYHSDQHLSWAFRHFISIPDDIFPLRWRKDYRMASSWKLGTVEDASINDGAKLEERQQAYERVLRNVDCGLYMAISNIQNAGYGAYAGVDIPYSQILVGSTIPEIPVNEHKDPEWAGTEYVWNSFGLAENPESNSVLLGLFGSIANSHNGIINMLTSLKQNSLYHPILDRKQHAGAGAFTPYIAHKFLSAYPVQAGEELFVSYGEHWYERCLNIFLDYFNACQPAFLICPVLIVGSEIERNTTLSRSWSTFDGLISYLPVSHP